MTKTIQLAISSLTLCLVTSAAQSAPLTWTIENAQFDDGSPMTGFFVFDASVGIANGYSNFNITTGTSGNFGETYGGSIDWLVGATSSSRSLDIFEDGEIVNRLVLIFEEDLTDVGGTISLLSSSFESDSLGGRRDVAMGQVSASPVPTPTTAWLLGPALGLLGWTRRRMVKPT